MPLITVVVPVCGKDAHLAVATLRLLAGWGKLDRYCSVAYERGFDPCDVENAARGAFANVGTLCYEPWHGRQEWPGPQNNAWFETARAFASFRGLGGFWLWLEPDAVPLRKGWLAELEAEYERLGKPIMGRRTRDGHVNGVAVYPADMVSLAPTAFLHFDHPFDRVLSQLVPGQMAHTDLIQSHWKARGGGTGRSFGGDEPVPNCALFHGCTDGTLQRVLAGEKVEASPFKETAAGILWLPPVLPPEVRRVPFARARPIGKPATMVHVVEMHKQRSEEARARVERAFRSWETLYADGCQPCHLWEDDYPRDSRAIGDDRRLPYLKDVLAAGLGLADIVVLTNDDTFLIPGLAAKIREALRDRECVSSFRGNIDLPAVGDAPVPGVKTDLGRDLFAFRDEWLCANWERISDMLLGEVEWDMVLAAMVRLANGEPFTLSNRGKPMPKSELLVGWVLHERHQPGWKGEPRLGRGYNRRLAAKWFVENGLVEIAGH